MKEGTAYNLCASKTVASMQNLTVGKGAYLCSILQVREPKTMTNQKIHQPTCESAALLHHHLSVTQHNKSVVHYI